MKLFTNKDLSPEEKAYALKFYSPMIHPIITIDKKEKDKEKKETVKHLKYANLAKIYLKGQFETTKNVEKKAEIFEKPNKKNFLDNFEKNLMSNLNSLKKQNEKNKVQEFNKFKKFNSNMEFIDENEEKFKISNEEMIYKRNINLSNNNDKKYKTSNNYFNHKKIENVQIDGFDKMRKELKSQGNNAQEYIM